MFPPMSLSFILLFLFLCGSHMYLPISNTSRSSVYQVIMIMPDVNSPKAGTHTCIFLLLLSRRINPKAKDSSRKRHQPRLAASIHISIR